MSSGPRHRVARPAQYTCRGSARSTWRSARVYVSTASDATGSPAAARARANPATPTSGSARRPTFASHPASSRSSPALATRSRSSWYLTTAPSVRRRGLRVEDVAVEFTQRPCPVQRLGDAGRLDQFHAAQGVHGACHLVGERLRDAGDAAAKNRDFARQVGMFEPVIEAAPLERVVHVAGAVGREHHQRWRCRTHLAEFGDGDRVLVEHLEQERLEFVVGPVDFVDEQHARRFGERPQQRTRQQEPLGVEGAFSGFGLEVSGAGRLQRPQVQQLSREIPVVECLRCVDALVALQPDQRQVQRLAPAPRRARSFRCRARPRRTAVVPSATRGTRPSRRLRRRGSRWPRAPVPVRQANRVLGVESLTSASLGPDALRACRKGVDGPVRVIVEIVIPLPRAWLLTSAMLVGTAVGLLAGIACDAARARPRSGPMSSSRSSSVCPARSGCC